MATPISGDQSLLFSFPSLSFDLLAPIKEKIKCDPAAQKKLDRARMLHNVLATRLAQQGVVPKVDDVKKLCIEWIHGLLEATFPLESALVDAECADGAALGKLLAALDGAKEIAVMLAKISPPAEAPATAPASAPAAASSSDSPRLATEAEAAELLQNAAASASAVWRDVVPGSAPEASALGYELWEALCWRRGALRYYIVASRVKQAGEAADPDDAAAVAAAGAAAAPHAAEAEAAVGALLALLRARCEGDGGGGNRLLRYGIFSTTHLLALAYVGELSYWRWAAGGGAADGGPAHADALKYVHRYQHVVDVLMAGCEWSTARSVELLRHLGGVAKLRPVLARELPEGEADAELERLREKAAGS